MGADNPPSLPLVGGWLAAMAHVYVPALEFVHLLDYVCMAHRVPDHSTI